MSRLLVGVKPKDTLVKHNYAAILYQVDCCEGIICKRFLPAKVVRSMVPSINAQLLHACEIFDFD